jgi:hypothetical protein
MTTTPMTINHRGANRAHHAPRYACRRPWWLGALDRELLALAQYVGHRTRTTVAIAAIFALIYFGANGGTLG